MGLHHGQPATIHVEQPVRVSLSRAQSEIRNLISNGTFSEPVEAALALALDVLDEEETAHHGDHVPVVGQTLPSRPHLHYDADGYPVTPADDD